MVERNSLSGQTALVTGGSRGIGFAAARGLALSGATVVLVARDPERVARAAEQLQGEGLDVIGFAADVSDQAAVQRMADERAPWYREVADLVIRVDGRSTHEVVEAVMR